MSEECWRAFNADILMEVDRGFVIPTTTHLRKINALGAVDKGNGKWRRITDLSVPDGIALNDFVEAPPFSFDSVDDAVDIIAQYKFVVAFKFDLQAAYRQVPVHIDHWDLCGFFWNGVYYLDSRLCFGYRKAPYVFWKISNFIKRVALGYFGVRFIVPYIDDFLVISVGDSWDEAFARAHVEFSQFGRCLDELGWEVAWHKVVKPSLVLSFLGIEIDLVGRTLAVPESKLTEILSVLESFNSRRFATKKQLQQLVGLLNFACKVIRGGRTFLRRMIDEMNSVKGRHQRVRLSSSFRRDVDWWLKFARTWNGRAVMIDQIPIDSRRFVVYASNLASAAIFDSEYIVHPFTEEEKSWHINAKEFLSIYLAALKWGSLWLGHKVIVESDNTTTVAAVNNGTSGSQQIMPLLRNLFWISARHNFYISAIHIAGDKNVLADAASRL